MPHTQGTQGIQGNSGNFQVKEISGKLRETQEISGNFNLSFILRETQWSFDFYWKIQGSFKIYKISEKVFARFGMSFN